MEVSNGFKAVIKAYLDDRASNDELFAATYAKPNKNLDECCNYILREVQKSGQNGFADEEIYGMAVLTQAQGDCQTDECPHGRCQETGKTQDQEARKGSATCRSRIIAI